jgi:transcriptional regulator with XRE-family HTH domain
MGIHFAAMSESMLDYVLDQLSRCKGQWPKVAEDTGVSKRTLEKIADGSIEDPGVLKIQKLAEYFRRQSAAA